MVTIKKRNLIIFTITLVLVLIISYISFFIPFEKELSTYRFTRDYPWYFHWRVALVNLIIWMISSILLSLDIMEAKYLLILSTILMHAASFSSTSLLPILSASPLLLAVTNTIIHPPDNRMIYTAPSIHCNNYLCHPL